MIKVGPSDVLGILWIFVVNMTLILLCNWCPWVAIIYVCYCDYANTIVCTHTSIPISFAIEYHFPGPHGLIKWPEGPVDV